MNFSNSINHYPINKSLQQEPMQPSQQRVLWRKKEKSSFIHSQKPPLSFPSPKLCEPLLLLPPHPLILTCSSKSPALARSCGGDLSLGTLSRSSGSPSTPIEIPNPLTVSPPNMFSNFCLASSPLNHPLLSLHSLSSHSHSSRCLASSSSLPRLG